MSFVDIILSQFFLHLIITYIFLAFRHTPTFLYVHDLCMQACVSDILKSFSLVLSLRQDAMRADIDSLLKQYLPMENDGNVN